MTTDAADILHRIAEWTGGEQQALVWYRTRPIPEFGVRTAEALVADGKAAAVFDFLERAAAGGFA